MIFNNECGFGGEDPTFLLTLPFESNTLIEQYLFYMNHERIQSTLLQALQEAGALLKSSFGSISKVEKKSELSLVTETDKRAESIVLEIITREFPDHAILSEESPPQGNSASRWIIDPLDGTTNFAHHLPICCVSIGYEEKGVIEMGGIFDPFRNELFFAARGRGAYLNDQKISVSAATDINDALLATGFPYDRRQKGDDYLAILRAFMMKCQGIRRLGAAALDLCYVACGRYDGFWEVQLNPWDKVAGMLLVQEAGGQVTNFSGEPLTLAHTQNVASNGKIHEAMLETLKPFQGVAL